MNVDTRGCALSLYTYCSNSAAPTPCATPPWIMPSTLAGFRRVPQSSAMK